MGCLVLFLVPFREGGQLFGVGPQDVVEMRMMDFMSVSDFRVVPGTDFGVLAKVAVMDVRVMFGHVSFLQLGC